MYIEDQYSFVCSFYLHFHFVPTLLEPTFLHMLSLKSWDSSDSSNLELALLLKTNVHCPLYLDKHNHTNILACLNLYALCDSNLVTGRFMAQF